MLPALFLWQRRTSSHRSARGSLLFICSLGCVLVLLFPVISASDDLHSTSQAMEESKRSFHYDSHSARPIHSVAHTSLFALPASPAASTGLQQLGIISFFAPRSLAILSASQPIARAPPA
ncbi:MAG: hypothetical protein WBQ72_10885 [Terriglobales bacterium]